jgi:hypothetical protein
MSMMKGTGREETQGRGEMEEETEEEMVEEDDLVVMVFIHWLGMRFDGFLYKDL